MIRIVFSRYRVRVVYFTTVNTSVRFINLQTGYRCRLGETGPSTLRLFNYCETAAVNFRLEASFLNNIAKLQRRVFLLLVFQGCILRAERAAFTSSPVFHPSVPFFPIPLIIRDFVPVTAEFAANVTMSHTTHIRFSHLATPSQPALAWRAFVRNSVIARKDSRPR